MGRIGNGIFLGAAAITASVGAELPPLAKGLILALGAAAAVSLTVLAASVSCETWRTARECGRCRGLIIQ